MTCYKGNISNPRGMVCLDSKIWPAVLAYNQTRTVPKMYKKGKEKHSSVIENMHCMKNIPGSISNKDQERKRKVSRISEEWLTVRISNTQGPPYPLIIHPQIWLHVGPSEPCVAPPEPHLAPLNTSGGDQNFGVPYMVLIKTSQGKLEVLIPLNDASTFCIPF